MRRGQILVVVAVAMIGLLLTAGLATDTGLILMRKAQLDRAVDAAVLAGAPVAGTSDTSAADLHALQILNANGIGLTNADKGCVGTLPNAVPLQTQAGKQFCGSAFPGNLPGTTDYHVNASWTVPLAFMSIFGGPFSGARKGGVAAVTLYGSAEASYYNTVDMFTSANDQGLLQSSNLELFGRFTCSNYGDAFSPLWYQPGGGSGAGGEVTNTDRADISPVGTYTYRIAVPEDYNDDNTHNLVRVELFDPQTANLATTGTSSMSLASNVGTSHTYNPSYGERSNLTSAAIACGGSQNDPCLPQINDPDNQFWYVRMDELRTNCGGSGTPVTTETQFRLYYYKQLASGQLVKTYLAQYTGKNVENGATDPKTTEAYKTALTWVSPVQNNIITLAGNTLAATPTSEQMPLFSCLDINNNDATKCTSGGDKPFVSSLIEPRVQVDAIPCSPMAGSVCPSPGASYSPWSNGDFVVDVGGDDVEDNAGNVIQYGDETADIYEDPASHIKYIYLEVQSMNGASENNWGVWAGPAVEEDPTDTFRQAPSFVNARQTYLYYQKNQNGQLFHTSNGVVVYGVGHLPYNSDALARTNILLANIGSELAGAQMTVELFDSDAGTYPPIMFYYDTIPPGDWSQCWEDTDGSANDTGASTDCNSRGSTQTWQRHTPTPKIGGNHVFGQACNVAFSCGQWAKFVFLNPTDADPNPPGTGTPPHPVPFYGGRLFVNYEGGFGDTFGWRITVQARPSLVY